MKNKLIILSILIILPLISANGINTVQNSFVINKTNGQNYFINITIMNQENFNFYNITSSNPILKFNKFNLNSGQNKTIRAEINTNNNYAGTIKIIGDYYTNLGASNHTYNINIDSSGLDVCNLDLIKGDKIIWKNKLENQIKLKNLNSNQYFSTIQATSTYSNIFNTPVEFNYQVFQVGLPLFAPCHLNIRPTQGYIHSSKYDKDLNFTIKINYKPTKISATFLTDSYTLNYNQQKEDIFKIKNTGTNVAKNIKLSAKWITFNQNNFDLGINQSKNIGFKISPLIFTTNQTNKTHKLIININGNFNKINKTIKVFVNYKKFYTSGNSTYNLQEMKNFVNMFCSIHPDYCPTQIIYSNGTDQNTSIIINEETYKEKILADSRFQNNLKSNIGTQNEKLMNLSKQISNITADNNNKNLNINKISSKLNDLTNVIIFTMLTLGFLALGGIILFLTMNERARIRLSKLLKRGERQW